MSQKKDPFLKKSRFHQFLAEYLFHHDKFLIVSPWGQRIGHISGEIMNAVCVSIRDNKQLILITPFKTVNHEIFQCQFNCSIYNRRDWKVWVLTAFLNLSLFFHYFYNGIRSKLVKLFPLLSKAIPSYFFYPMYGIEKGNYGEHRIKGTSYYWSCELYLSQNYQVSLNSNQINRGRAGQSKMGIPEDSWFVCLHVREPGYAGPTLGDANILNYLSAIKYITQKGGYVLRMGDNSMTPLPKMKNVIDYALSEFKSELMDVYLVSRCRFFIGCCSGFSDLVKFFKKPTCLVNVYPSVATTPYFPNYMFILKHVYSIKKKRILTYKEALTSDSIANSIYDPSEHFLIENSPEDILEAIREYLFFLENLKFKGDDKIQEEVQNVRKQYCEYMLKNGLAKKALKKFIGVLPAQGRVADFYLNRYWEETKYLKEKSDLYHISIEKH
ncbi:MAG: hypothetical protein CMQ15_16145 [Gammaproteobacteria bacterium]|nr:hypothetical protein [Gammaproteobacteria bacterium]|tara:strand:- start:872 stop:2191 length:1320 start_codon:yes stop_codon:yes gene_type:complete